jgi:hypothetical protein
MNVYIAAGVANVLRRYLPWALLLLVLVDVAGHGDRQASGLPRDLSVVIVEDVERRAGLPAGQLDQLTSDGPESLIAWMRANCKEWRIIDAEDDTSRDVAIIRELAAKPRKSAPWIATSGRVSEALPPTAAETIKKLKAR